MTLISAPSSVPSRTHLRNLVNGAYGLSMSVGLLNAGRAAGVGPPAWAPGAASTSALSAVAVIVIWRFMSAPWSFCGDASHAREGLVRAR